MNHTVYEDLKRISTKINLIFAYIFAFLPLIATALSKVDLGILIILFSAFYLIFLFLRIFEFAFYKDKKVLLKNLIKKPGVWITLVLFFTILISTILTNINIHTLIYFSYFLI